MKLLKIFPRTHGPEVFLVACLLLLVLSLIPGSKAIGNEDGTGSNGSLIPTRNEQVNVPINIIVLLWNFYLRFKVWLRYWGLGCKLNVLNVFKKKISVLQTAYGRASKAGEKSLAKLLNGWKTGPKYQVKSYSNEVAVQKVKTQCEIKEPKSRHSSDLYLR